MTSLQPVVDRLAGHVDLRTCHQVELRSGSINAAVTGRGVARSPRIDSRSSSDRSTSPRPSRSTDRRIDQHDLVRPGLRPGRPPARRCSSHHTRARDRRRPPRHTPSRDRAPLRRRAAPATPTVRRGSHQPRGGYQRRRNRARSGSAARPSTSRADARLWTGCTTSPAARTSGRSRVHRPSRSISGPDRAARAPRRQYRPQRPPPHGESRGLTSGRIVQHPHITNHTACRARRARKRWPSTCALVVGRNGMPHLASPDVDAPSAGLPGVGYATFRHRWPVIRCRPTWHPARGRCARRTNS